jgi:hypothetical protein
MVLTDWCNCPSCGLPSIKSELIKITSGEEKSCPMCEQAIVTVDLKNVEDPAAELKSLSAVQKEVEAEEEEEEDEEDV